MSTRVNLATVAREAGVAISTASHVLNGKADKVGIAAKTILRIQQAAERLAYTPNHSARTLRLRYSGLIGMIVSGMGNEVPRALLEGVRASIEDINSEMVPLLTSHEYDSERELKELRFLMRTQVEAVISTPIGPYDKNYASLVAAGVPVVFAMHGLQDMPETISCVSIDSAAMAAAGIEHLIKTGARRIAYLGWDYETLMSKEKLDGVQRSMLEFPAETASAGIFMQKPGRKFDDCLDALFASPKHAPDAILCNPWEVAINCLDYLDRHNIRVPEDCSLFSLNDYPFFSMERIGISAIIEDGAFIGKRAADAAMALVGSKTCKPIREKHKAFKIISRKTTRPII